MVDLISRSTGLSLAAETRMFQILESVASFYSIKPYDNTNKVTNQTHLNITNFVIDVLTKEFEISGSRDKSKKSYTKNMSSILMSTSQFLGLFDNNLSDDFQTRYLQYLVNTKS